MRCHTFANRPLCSLSPWAVTLVLAAAPLVAGATLRTAGSPRISFTALGPAGLRIVGTTHDLVVSDDGTDVTVSVPLRHLTTGIDLRDQHMREALGTARYRTADLVVPRAQLRFPDAGRSAARVTGTLRLHGRARRVELRYSAERVRGSLVVRGSFRIDMRQFGIQAPRYMGLTVHPDVDVGATFSVVDR